MVESTGNFPSLFEALTGHGPYPWQEDLFGRLLDGKPPTALDVPTGLGKTSVIPIWFLSHLLGTDPASRPPMRLVYVVNRRTIVDQATDEAVKLARRVEASPPVRAAWDERFPGRYDPNPPAEADESQEATKRRSQSDRRLPVSTLRGALADNGDWLLTPHRPSVIIGTVDMIGSRLLFNGYRTGRWQRSRHAGLIGWDTLLVHDEAHLSEPFQKVLEWVRSEQPPGPRRLRLLPMSATSVGDDPGVLRITAADREQERPAKILRAAKRVRLHEPAADVEGQLAALATGHGATPSRVVVFVRTPDMAKKVQQRLTAKKPHGIDSLQTEVLTGTLRGHERDALVDGPIWRHLTAREPPTLERAEYLIATSAGEVGADLDADHLVCDLSTLDAMFQRLGRVNRRGGGGRVPRIDVVLDRPKVPKARKDGTPGEMPEFDRRRLRTMAFLTALAAEADAEGFDASPATVAGDPDAGRPGWRDRAGYAEACEPSVPWAEPHPATLDAWSLTSVRGPWPVARPVEPYLHGVDRDAPRTTVAWRAELGELPSGVRSDPTAIEQVLEDHPLLPREVLQERPDVVADLLLAVRRRAPTTPVAVVRRAGVELMRADELPDDAKRLAAYVGDITVILPTGAGGLANGMVDPAATGSVEDVADDRPPTDRARFVVAGQTDGEQVRWRSYPLPRQSAPEQSQADGPDPADLPTRWSAARDAIRLPGLQPYSRIALAAGDEGTTKWLILFRKVPAKTDRTDPPTVAAHNDAVRAAVERRVARLLSAGSPEATALVAAAAAHDLGKAWTAGGGRWQNAAGNKDTARSVAKSFRRLDNSLLERYRHEFGSLLQAVTTPIDSAVRDLTFHLIGSHHGRGRPHFEWEAMKVAQADLDAELTPAAVARRFDRLQRQYGHWQLAWLESILMSADVEVSRAEERPNGGAL